MKIMDVKIGEYAKLTGFLQEPDSELGDCKAFPAVLILPGGAFRICSMRESDPVALAYVAEGFTAFVLRYTTVTSKPDATIEDPMEDVQNALTWIRGHAKELKIIPDQIAMLGFSGGGHLASASATHGPGRPDALLLGYPGILHSKLRALECPDIIECVDEHTPPAFIFSTRNDAITPPEHPLAFAQALNRAGVDFELHIFREGQHGLSLAKPVTAGGQEEMINSVFAQWFPMSVRWLRDLFGR